MSVDQSDELGCQWATWMAREVMEGRVDMYCERLYVMSTKCRHEAKKRHTEVLVGELEGGTEGGDVGELEGGTEGGDVG